MHAAPKLTTGRALLPRLRLRADLLILCTALIAAPALSAQTPQPSATEAPAAAQPDQIQSDQNPPDQNQPNQSQSDPNPVLRSHTIAIVPVGNTMTGAALSVSGQLQTWNERAFITSSGSVTAGAQTAQVALPYRGTLRVCASSSVNLTTDSSVPNGDLPGLLIALDHGAVEMSFAASSGRERNADTLLTPYFRILIGGPDAADVKVRQGDNGDTCVDNAGPTAPYVVVTSVFDGGIYRVQPGQRVMFEHGSLQTVVDQEKEPCGCPPPAKSHSNEFPLAQSEGLTLTPKPVSGAPNPGRGRSAQVAPLTYNGADRVGANHAQQTATVPQPSASPTAAATAKPPHVQSKTREKGFFGKVGHFFKRVFGAEE